MITRASLPARFDSGLHFSGPPAPSAPPLPDTPAPDAPEKPEEPFVPAPEPDPDPDTRIDPKEPNLPTCELSIAR